MKLTTFSDYSLRVLIYLAVQPQRRATIAEVAAAFRVSEHDLDSRGWIGSRGERRGSAAPLTPPYGEP